jgi:hypothetical protein
LIGGGERGERHETVDCLQWFRAGFERPMSQRVVPLRSPLAGRKKVR